MDEPLSITGLPAPAPEPPPPPPRKPAARHLPDGTPLHLTAGILCDLASIYHDDFTGYIPQRHDEFATMIWMAHFPRAAAGAAWRDPRPEGPPLLSDFPALRATVSRWIDKTFTPSESDMVRTIALDLWMHAAGARVTIAEKKNPPDMTAQP